MKKIYLGIIASIVFLAAGVFFYFFENICFQTSSKQVIGPFTAFHPDPTYFCVPDYWSYIFIGGGVVLFVLSVYFKNKHHHG